MLLSSLHTIYVVAAVIFVVFQAYRPICCQLSGVAVSAELHASVMVRYTRICFMCLLLAINAESLAVRLI